MYPSAVGPSEQTQGGYSRWRDQRLGFGDPSLSAAEGIFWSLKLQQAALEPTQGTWAGAELTRAAR